MLSTGQQIILRHMLIAVLIVLSLVVFSWYIPLNLPFSRLYIFLLALILPIFSYIIGIVRIAGLRFFDESVSNRPISHQLRLCYF